MAYLSMIGGLMIDHIGLTTPDLDAALAGVWSDGAEIIRGPSDNLERGVRQAFVRVRSGETIELLMPLPGAMWRMEAARTIFVSSSRISRRL